jgi:ribosomal protein L11 methylase PrmA
VLEKRGNSEVVRELIARLGDTVLDGPFAGLRLTPMTRAEQIGPYLLGTYERELGPAWGLVLQGTYRQIIDVGAKVGFYAIGLARRYPETSVVAFDTDWWARKAVREMARANGCGNVSVLSFCDPKWFAIYASDSALVVCDCEGYEALLFTPEAVAALRNAALIIETHDDLVPGASETVRVAFNGTHDLHVLGNQTVDRSASAPLEFLTGAQREIATHEIRPSQIWILCLPRQGPNCHLRESSVVSKAELSQCVQ